MQQRDSINHKEYYKTSLQKVGPKDTHSAFQKFQHTVSNQLEDLKKNGILVLQTVLHKKPRDTYRHGKQYTAGLPRLSSRIDSLEEGYRQLSRNVTLL